MRVIINTCAGTKDQSILARRSSFNNKLPYATRATKLSQVITRYYKQDFPFEFGIIGEWPADDFVDWVIHYPGPTRSPVDPIYQRQAGCFIDNHELTVFMNDDHFITPQDLRVLAEKYGDADAITFDRAAWINGVRERRETGWPTYLMGHACALSQKALLAVPWSQVPPTANWDAEHGKLLTAAGFEITNAADITAWDIEDGELPPV